ncbi:MAG TPA: TerC family protein [Hypericibacter adhaerens]|jgi:YjbE family integral membrane protein|uniref:Membrane protein n=1 Tax=Hypericibacter adhaerens TaxID=2602016 RepID=A0A5J6N6A6_9PROT|nr:TerC family protein [Hypericibacter adhaerens]QEX24465.1 membrane protein [Hypericibacter adhaerens]HWA41710.1 TerC family protein [Hypericibacter adhaerens]
MDLPALDFTITLSEITAFLQVIMVDLVLAGDNAIVVGVVAASLPKHQRARVIFLGIAAATVMRVGFAVITTQLLQIIGLTLAGGLLLLWVCWKLWREVEAQRRERKAEKALQEAAARGGGSTAALHDGSHAHGHEHKKAPPKTVGQAVMQIVLADLSMSLDNVLAVAGIARDHAWVLVFGLVLSVALMGAAATLIANMLRRWPWLVYIGLAIIFYVACHMIYDGTIKVYNAAQTAALF